MKINVLLALFLFYFTFSYAIEPDENRGSKFTISGYVKDKTNGEVLIGATIFIKELKTGTATNQYGFYSISIAPGNYTLIYSYLGFLNIEKRIELTSNKTVNIELELESTQLNEVEISAEKKNKNIVNAEMSVQKLESNTIKKIPALFGEVDVLKVIQMLPGVSTLAEGSSGFSVRGGNMDQNLILIDEAPVYSSSHLMGFFSVFNSDAVKDLMFYKGDIPAQYGGRLSSLLDIRMKDGNLKKLSGSGGVGIISSRLTLEGPIIKDRTSFIASGRRTYADKLFLPFAKDKFVRESKLYFYDANAKLTHQINENNKVFISGYFGNDLFKNKYAGIGFGNSTATARWNHVFSNKIFHNLTFVYSRYDYKLTTQENQPNSLEWKYFMEDYSLKSDFTYYLNTLNTIKFGASSTYHTFAPGTLKGIGEKSIFKDFKLPEHYSFEHAVYASNSQNITSKLTLKYGLRFTAFQNIGVDTIYNLKEYKVVDTTTYKSHEFFNTYPSFEPRIGFNYVLNEKNSIKGSYSRTTQFIHLAQQSTAGTPLDIWYACSPNVKPEMADQVALGYFRNFLNNKIETSIESYYKKMHNASDIKDFANLFFNKTLEAELRFGEAQSYGTEFYIKLNEKKTSGWISYTLSRTTRTIQGINNGKEYLAPFDKPHVINFVFNRDITKKLSFSVNWVYATGNPATFPAGRGEYQGYYFKIYTDRNTYRYPDYHRLDLSLILKGKEHPKTLWQGEWIFSVYNAYNRHNPWSINFVQENGSTKPESEMTYLFPILPSISYNFKF